MKLNKIITMALLMALTLALPAQAATIERAWMEYEDYSGGRAEQSVESAADIETLERILRTAKGNPGELDGCTMNCTLFCMTPDGEIYDFACATDGCPYIQSGTDGAVYNLGVDYGRFWELFADVQEGMGFDANIFFDYFDLAD